jgi:polyisoprenoid-binding protein YceI
MKRLLIACALSALSLGASQSLAGEIKPVKTAAPAGVYAVDKPHTSLILRIDHLGFSHFTARFTGIDATLQGDPKQPAKAKLEATIDTASLESDNAPPGFLDMLRGPQWLNAKAYPKITFRSTKIEMTAPNAARITGDLSLHGVTKPIVLDATFNGGYAGFAMDPHARIGFSAHGSFKRSDFGLTFGIPAPGTTMGVGDKIDVVIETEFTGPAWKPCTGSGC